MHCRVVCGTVDVIGPGQGSLLSWCSVVDLLFRGCGGAPLEWKARHQPAVGPHQLFRIFTFASY